MDRVRIRFGSDSSAQRATVIFAETLQDLYDKYENGGSENPRYEKGFLHTSTVQHEGTCYYRDMWLRDCARGMIELSRFGFADEALEVAEYFLKHITFGNHWGREIHSQRREHELDGNALALLGIYNVWKAAGMDPAIANDFSAGIKPVLLWIHETSSSSPYHGLLPSISELSGNPNTPYPVYPVWGNYCMVTALKSIELMVAASDNSEIVELIREAYAGIEAGLEKLISDGSRFTLVPKDCWINGIDGRDGRAYEQSEWDGTSWPIWHWTRQLPFICGSDFDTLDVSGKFSETNIKSYEFIKSHMNNGYYFRKYGFVSNSGWSGMGGRHDDTMGGYGQGFYTQAALMSDDVNTYTKCLEGISRLGYDGDVAEPLSFEMNPWIMHECFSYENYEQGKDHTFGADSNGRREIMQNPGDEGNLAQEAEILKVFALVAGITYIGDKLNIMPRLPWEWDRLEVLNWPVVDESGIKHAIGMDYRHDRWLRRCSLRLTGMAGIRKIEARFGPFAHFIKDGHGYEIEKSSNASWIRRIIMNHDNDDVIEAEVNL